MPSITPLQDSGQYEGQSSLLFSVQEALLQALSCAVCTRLTLQGCTCLIPPVPAPDTKTSARNYLRNNVPMHPFDPAPGVGSRNPCDQETVPPGSQCLVWGTRSLEQSLNERPSCASRLATVSVSHPRSWPLLPAVSSGNSSCVFKMHLPRVQNPYFSFFFLQGE